jgi:hypothetical protein
MAARVAAHTAGVVLFWLFWFVQATGSCCTNGMPGKGYALEGNACKQNHDYFLIANGDSNDRNYTVNRSTIDWFSGR